MGVKGQDQFHWSDEAISKLTSLHTAGKSGGEIARVMGVSRNTVIGKIHRLHLPRPTGHTPAIGGKIAPTRSARTQPTRSRNPVYAKVDKPFNRSIPTEAVIAFPSRAPKPIPTGGAEPGEKITLLQLGRHMCKWPIGDPLKPSFSFCGDGVETEGDSYCAVHAKKAFVPHVDKRREARDLERLARRA